MKTNNGLNTLDARNDAWFFELMKTTGARRVQEIKNEIDKNFRVKNILRECGVQSLQWSKKA